MEVISDLDVSLLHACCWIKVQQGYDLYPHGIYRGYSTKCKTIWIMVDALYLFGRNLEQSCGCGMYILHNPDGFLVITKAWNTRCVQIPKTNNNLNCIL